MSINPDAEFFCLGKQKPEQAHHKTGKDAHNDSFPEQFELEALPVVEGTIGVREIGTGSCFCSILFMKVKAVCVHTKNP